ncbi:MAG: type I-E CRISPR-associated protein Cse2/CasB [Acidobacteriota bacterium]
MKDSALPDFRSLKEAFDNRLDNGQRAELGRVRYLDDLPWTPALYRLLPEGVRPRPAWCRIAYLLPWVPHRDGAPSLGTQLAKSGISEMRLFQVLRSEPPRDLTQLRRLCQHVEPSLDWREFGRTLFFWQRRDKQRIVEDYYLAGGGRSSRPQTSSAKVKESK